MKHTNSQISRTDLKPISGIKVAYKAYLCLYVLSVVPFAINGLALHYDMLGAGE